MNEELKKKAQKASGTFVLKVAEDNEEIVTVDVKSISLFWGGDLVYITGRANDEISSQGVDFGIKNPQPDTTYYCNKDVKGNYNPKKFEGRSWDSEDGSGEVVIEKIDFTDKTIKGTYKFTAKPVDGKKIAVINGDFDLKV